jgi:hypothetical protein
VEVLRRDAADGAANPVSPDTSGGGAQFPGATPDLTTREVRDVRSSSDGIEFFPPKNRRVRVPSRRASSPLVTVLYENTVPWSTWSLESSTAAESRRTTFGVRARFEATSLYDRKRTTFDFGRRSLLASRAPASACERCCPLFDVVLLGTTGDSWTLAGYERSTSGALQQEFFLGQNWLVTPAPLEELRNAENEWARLSKLLAEVQQREK